MDLLCGEMTTVFGQGPFSPIQTNLLRRIVERVGERASAMDGAFEYFADDIVLSAEKC